MKGWEEIIYNKEVKKARIEGGKEGVNEREWHNLSQL